jgi:hypothetical protein
MSCKKQCKIPFNQAEYNSHGAGSLYVLSLVKVLILFQYNYWLHSNFIQKKRASSFCGKTIKCGKPRVINPTLNFFLKTFIIMGS